MADMPSAQQGDAYARIHQSPEFIELKRRYIRFVFPVTIAFMVWYLTYVICSNWAGDFMDNKVAGNVNVALVFGLLQFLTTFLIAWWYSRYSAKNTDPIADKLRSEFEEAGQ